MRRLPIIITSSILAFAALAVVTRAGEAPVAVAKAAAEPAGDTVTAHGTGTIDVTPDRAQLWIGVESQAPTARAALAANAADMRKVIAALRAAGVSDIQTQSVNLSQRFVEGRGADGYTAQNSVSVTVKQLAQAGAVIDAAVAAGANQVSGPSLTHSDPAALYRRALEKAVDDARRNAAALAGAAGLTLGRVTAVVEGSASSPPLPFAARAAEDSGSPPIEPGKQQVSATVTVTFAAS